MHLFSFICTSFLIPRETEAKKQLYNAKDSCNLTLHTYKSDTYIQHGLFVPALCSWNPPRVQTLQLFNVSALEGDHGLTATAYQRLCGHTS